MPRRRLRVVVPALCLLSLIVCVGATCLWWRSYRVHGRLGYRTVDGRYTLHALRGRLLISATPPNGPDDETARKPAARMSNDELVIYPAAFRGADGTWRYEAIVEHQTGKGLPCSEFAWRYGPLPANDPVSAWPPLLQALEDPKKFAAADHMLGRLWSSIHPLPGRGVAAAPLPANPLGLPTTRPFPKPSEVQGEDVTVYANFVPIHFRTSDLSPDTRNRRFASRVGPPGVARVDTSEGAVTAVRNFWHDQLDVVVWSMPLFPLVVLSAMPPLVWSFSRARAAIVRRRRARLGLCPSCGYDWRASRGNCSECGADIPDRTGDLQSATTSVESGEPPRPEWQYE